MIVFQKDSDDRVEGQSGGIGTDHIQYLLSTVLTENQNGRMDFGYRFYAETVIVITYCDFLAIQQADTNAEQVLVDISQIRDVIGILTTCIILELLVGLLCSFLYLLNRN